MKLTKQWVAGVKFRSRGKWYHAGQVDVFLEELLVAADEANRELTEEKGMVRVLTEQLENLREENVRLRDRAEKAPVPAETRAEEERGLLCRELEKERDRLIQDIKALQDFREAFRASIERDAASLTEQIKGFESDKLL